MAAFASTTEAPAAAQSTDRDVRDIVQALRDVRTAIVEQKGFALIAELRKRQTDFLRAQGKFPDFIDVGTDVWFAVHDWHVKNLQPLTLGRDATGRYTIMLLFTTLVMRTEFMATYTGTPYDTSR